MWCVCKYYWYFQSYLLLSSYVFNVIFIIIFGNTCYCLLFINEVIEALTGWFAQLVKDRIIFQPGVYNSLIQEDCAHQQFSTGGFPPQEYLLMLESHGRQGKDATAIQWAEARDAVKHPAMHRTALIPIKELNCLARNVNKAEGKKPWSKHTT